MDYCIDSSKLPEVISNPAVPKLIAGKEPYNDFFHTYSLLQIDHTVSKENYLFPQVTTSSNWEENLSTNNSHIIKYLSGKPILVQPHQTTEKKIIQPVSKEYVMPLGVNNFIIFILLLSLILLAWLKFNFSKYLMQVTNSIITYSESVKLYHDHNALVDRVYFVLNLIFVLSGGLLIYNFLNFINANISSSLYSVYLISCLFVILLLFYRITFAKLSGFILKQKSAFDEYNHSNLLFYKAVGIILLPLTAFLTFIKNASYSYLLYACIGLLSVFFIISIFRGTRIMLQKGVLLFYWILYLCTIEIIPLLLLFKYLNKTILGL